MNFIKKHSFLFVVIIIIICIYSFHLYKDNRNIKRAQTHNINNLYKSDDRIYKNYLDKNEKKMYDLMLDNILRRKRNIIIRFADFDCSDYKECGELVKTSNDAIHVDHPELMSYAFYMWKYHNGVFKLSFYFGYPFDFMDIIGVARINSIVNEIVKETENMSDINKIIYVYEWMSKNNKYDKQFTYASDNQSIYSVFIYKSAVCAGFAKASQIILSRMGIESYVVSGYSTGPHMWNIVKYNDKYYYFDSTVGISLNDTGHHYGLSQDFLNSYSMDHSEWYPKVETTNMY